MRELRAKSIELINFRSIDHIVFDFSKNQFILIVGPNGAGKTTIFSGVSWVVYDETVDGVSGDAVVNNKIGKDCAGFFKYTDGVDDYELRSYRKHKKFQNKRFLLKNGVDISENTAKDTLAKIEKIFMPKPVFMNCLLFSQFIKGNFLKQGHSGQKEILDMMLDLGRYDTYYDNAKELEKRANLELERIRATSAVDISLTQEIKQDITNSTSKKTEVSDLYTRRLQECETNGKAVATTLTQLKGQLGDYDQYDTQRDALSNKVAALAQQLESLTSECDGEVKHATTKLDLNTTATRVKSEFTDKLTSIDTKRSTLRESKSQTVTDYTTETTSLESTHKDELLDIETRKRETCKEFEDVLTELRQQHITATENTKRNTKLIEENTATKSKISDALNQEIAICDRCKQPLTSKTAIKHMKDELTRINEIINTLTTELNEQTEAVKRIAEKGLKTKDQLTETQKRFDLSITNNKAQFDARFKEVKSKYDAIIKKIESDLNELTTQYTNLSNQMSSKVEEAIKVEKAALEIEVTEIKDRFRKLGESKFIEKGVTQTELNTVNDKLKERDILRTNINETEVKLATAKTTYTGLKTQLKNELTNIDARVEQLNSKLVDIEIRATESQLSIADIDKRINILKFWKIAFADGGIRGIILDEAIPTLNHRARELCEMVPEIQVRFDSTRETKTGASRNKFTVSALQTEKLSTYEQMSSGEKRLADIIVLLCLRHLLESTSGCKINIMLLDEILDSLDPENSINAVNMFKLLSRDHCVVLISHTMRDAIDADQTLRM